MEIQCSFLESAVATGPYNGYYFTSNLKSIFTTQLSVRRVIADEWAVDIIPYSFFTPETTLIDLENILGSLKFLPGPLNLKQTVWIK